MGQCFSKFRKKNYDVRIMKPTKYISSRSLDVLTPFDIQQLRNSIEYHHKRVVPYSTSTVIEKKQGKKSGTTEIRTDEPPR